MRNLNYNLPIFFKNYINTFYDKRKIGELSRGLLPLLGLWCPVETVVGYGCVALLVFLLVNWQLLLMASKMAAKQSCALQAAR